MQLAELRDVESRLYAELIKTPQQGEAFAEVIKTVLDRETAFVKWKAEGATPFWEKAVAAPKTATSCKLHGPFILPFGLVLGFCVIPVTALACIVDSCVRQLVPVP